MSQQEFITIDIRQARVGLFVSLDLSWLDHPFLTSSFKIKDEKQLDLLKRLGLTTLRYNPERSDGQASNWPRQINRPLPMRPRYPPKNRPSSRPSRLA